MRFIAYAAVCAACFGSGLMLSRGAAKEDRGAKTATVTNDDPLFKNGVELKATGQYGGVWVSKGDVPEAPFGAMYVDKWAGNIVLGLSKSAEGKGFDFAVVANKKECYFQIRDEKGEFHFLPTSALLKLADRKDPPR